MTSEMKALNCGLVSSNSWASKKHQQNLMVFHSSLNAALIPLKLNASHLFFPWGIVPIALIADGEDTFDVLINNL